MLSFTKTNQNIPGCQFLPMYPECIYYDTISNKWSTDGCEVSLVITSKSCKHLWWSGLIITISTSLILLHLLFKSVILIACVRASLMTLKDVM